jgi:hypothetical protein
MNYAIIQVNDKNGIPQDHYSLKCKRCDTGISYRKEVIDSSIQNGWITEEDFDKETYCYPCRKIRNSGR